MTFCHLCQDLSKRLPDESSYIFAVIRLLPDVSDKTSLSSETDYLESSKWSVSHFMSSVRSGYDWTSNESPNSIDLQLKKN